MFLELVVSGVAGALVGVLHSWVGERKFLPPVLNSTSPSGALKNATVRRVLRGVWHLPSVAWIGLGAALLFVGLTGQPSMVLAITAAGTFCVSSVTNLSATRVAHPGGILLGIAGIASAVHVFAQLST